MRVTIPRELEMFVRAKVDVGSYRSADDVVTDGLRLLKEQDQAEFEALRTLLKQRMKQSKAGISVPFDREACEGIRRRGMARLRSLKRKRK